MTDDFFFNFGNSMREHTITIPEKEILEEIGLAENDSNTEEGSFEKTKHALGKKVDCRELESEIFCGGSGPNVASQLSVRGIPSIVFAGFGRGHGNLADSIGEDLIRDLRDYGVGVLPVYKDEQSCEIFTLNHGWNRNRTFAPKLAAAAAVTPDEVPYNYLDLSSYVFLTQYKLHDCPETTRAIAEKAWSVNMEDPDLGRIVWDLSSEIALDGGKDLADEFLEYGVHMILSNVGESEYMFGVDIYESEKDRLDVARKLLESSELVVLKLNDEGALIANKEGFYHADAVQINEEDKANENGLGDGLATGVFEVLIKYGYNHADSLQKAISLGVDRASEIYAVQGPKKMFNAEAYDRIISNSYHQLTPW